MGTGPLCKRARVLVAVSIVAANIFVRGETKTKRWPDAPIVVADGGAARESFDRAKRQAFPPSQFRLCFRSE